MLKGSRLARVQHIQPVSIHGQISLDVLYLFEDDETGQPRVARVWPEAMDGGIEAGDRVELEFLLGAVTHIGRAR
jgi:hypothetical protein